MANKKKRRTMMMEKKEKGKPREYHLYRLEREKPLISPGTPGQGELIESRRKPRTKWSKAPMKVQYMKAREKALKQLRKKK